MTVDLNLPAFGLDCREWLVATEAEGLVVEQTDGAPIVAVLSTAIVVGSELVSARAVLTLALLDDDDAHEFGPSADIGDFSDHLEARDAGGEVSRQPGAHGTGAQDIGAQDTGTQGICVLDALWSDGYARFAVPAPGGELAVVAEFTSAPDPSAELIDRFYDLVTSFRWAA